MKKTIISLLMLLPSIADMAQYLASFESGGIHYGITSYTEKTIEVTRNPRWNDDGEVIGSYYEGDINIPSEVVVASDYVYNNWGDENLVKAGTYTVTGIRSRAFYKAYNVTSVTIPNSVTSIGKNAFEYCTNLGSITIPNSVTSIGENAFSNCCSLSRFVVEAGNKVYDSRNNCNAIIEKTNNKLIAGCKTTIIPNSVTSIGDYAFYNCKGLTSITIPSSVTSIGDYAFYGCNSYRYWLLDTAAGYGNWIDCSGLTSVTIANSVTSIGNEVFYDCTNLTSITIGDTQMEMVLNETYKLANANGESFDLTLVVKPDKAKELFDFSNLNWSSSNENVAKVDDSGKVTIVGEGNADIIVAAENLPNIKKATCKVVSTTKDYIYVGGIYYLPYTDGHAEVTNMMLGLDTGENERTEYSGTINIPATVTWKGKTYNVTAIHEYAFKRMKDLQGVVIPASVSVIKHQSFCNSSKLARVIFMNADKSELTDIQDSAFYGCSVLNNVTLPNSTLLLGKYSFADCVALSKITLSNKLSFIDEYAFSGCTELSSITLPESLNSIQNYAFSNDTKLEEITFPSELEGIGAGCFLNCSAMQMVTFNTTIATMTVGADAFSGCTKLSKVNVKDLGSMAHTNFNTEKSNPLSLAHHLFQNDKELTTANVPEGTMYVNNYAFSGCTSLKEIYLPSTIQYVNDNIFYNCTALIAVHCKAEMVPPFLGTDDPTKMNNVFNKATLYVPKDVMSDYKTDDWWKRFKSVEGETTTQKVGDTNGDGNVNTVDVVAVYTFVEKGDASGFTRAAADVNGDGSVNTADVVAIYSIIINGSTE